MFGHLAEANASGAILVVYGRLSSDATPLPLACSGGEHERRE
jgi:hypothetical protein